MPIHTPNPSAGDGYIPSPLEKKLYEKLFNLFQQGEYHVTFSSSEYGESYPKIIKALENLDNAGVLFFISKEPDEACVELDYRYCSTFVEL